MINKLWENGQKLRNHLEAGETLYVGKFQWKTKMISSTVSRMQIMLFCMCLHLRIRSLFEHFDVNIFT